MSRYRHFKGNLYEVITEACHSETGEALVIYRRVKEKEDGTHETWARPYDDFHGMHESGVKRFVEVDE